MVNFMNIKTDIILEFFDIKYFWKNGIPKIQLSLKQNKKITNKFPIKAISKYGKKVSQTGLNYYIHYLGNEIGNIVYNERKKLYSKTQLLKWYIKEYNPIDKDELIKYDIAIKNNLSISLNNFYKIPSIQLNEVKKKYKLRSDKWSKIIGKQNSERWKDKIWSDNYSKNQIDSGANLKRSITRKKYLSDPKNKEKFLLSMRSKNRKEKVSINSKQMWNKWKNESPEIFYKMINQTKHKLFSLNNIKMNSIEYIVGTILTELNLNWEYEKIYNIKKLTIIPDFTIEDNKIIIECFGDYWHANPNKFNAKDKIFNTILAEDKWNQDNNKKLLFESIGYKHLIFWEYDIINNIEEIKEIIKNATK